MEEDPVEDCALWISGTVDSGHDRDIDSRNRPGGKHWEETPQDVEDAAFVFPEERREYIENFGCIILFR